MYGFGRSATAYVARGNRDVDAGNARQDIGRSAVSFARRWCGIPRGGRTARVGIVAEPRSGPRATFAAALAGPGPGRYSAARASDTRTDLSTAADE